MAFVAAQAAADTLSTLLPPAPVARWALGGRFEVSHGDQAQLAVGLLTLAVEVAVA